MSDTQKEVNAAIKIQAVQRGKQGRDEKVKQEEAAIKIQAIQRGKQARDETGKSEEDNFAWKCWEQKLHRQRSRSIFTLIFIISAILVLSKTNFSTTTLPLRIETSINYDMLTTGSLVNKSINYDMITTGSLVNNPGCYRKLVNQRNSQLVPSLIISYYTNKSKSQHCELCAILKGEPGSDIVSDVSRCVPCNAGGSINFASFVSGTYTVTLREIWKPYNFTYENTRELNASECKDLFTNSLMCVWTESVKVTRGDDAYKRDWQSPNPLLNSKLAATPIWAFGDSNMKRLYDRVHSSLSSNCTHNNTYGKYHHDITLNCSGVARNYRIVSGGGRVNVRLMSQLNHLELNNQPGEKTNPIVIFNTGHAYILYCNLTEFHTLLRNTRKVLQNLSQKGIIFVYVESPAMTSKLWFRQENSRACMHANSLVHKRNILSIRAFCSVKGVICIDDVFYRSMVFKDINEYYVQDGIHLGPRYYHLVLNRIKQKILPHFLI